ncbi:MAG: DUF835 domain-containing protein [Thermoplasmatales archaeon]
MNDDSSYKKGYRDGLKYALILAKSLGVGEDYVKRLESEYSGQETRKALKFEYGDTYIIYEKSNEKGLEIVGEVAEQGYPVIIISRDYRKNLVGFKNVKLAVVTYEEISGGFNPNQLSQIQEFVINNLKDGSILYIDCIDYILSTSNSPHNVMRFLTVLKDKVIGRSGILIISINKDAIGKAELSMIEKEFKNTLDIKT